MITNSFLKQHSGAVRAAAVLLIIVCSLPLPVHAEGFLNKVFFMQRNETPSQKDRTSKDLLRSAIDHAVFEASQVNGFYHEADMKIQIPDQIKKVEDISRKLKVERFWNDMELGLNRAAEKAAPKAGVLMKNALEDLQFENPDQILRDEGSLTLYFRRKTEERLKNDFKQEIERSVSGENKLASYVEMKNFYSAIPFVKNSDKVFSLEDEISRKALDGIFSRIEKEENRLRAVQYGSK